MSSGFVFDKNTMMREYLYITNRDEIRDKLADHGMDNCILLNNDIPEEADIQLIKSEEKRGHFFLMYFGSDEEHRGVKKIIDDNQMRRATLVSNMVQLPFPEIAEYKDKDGLWDDEDLPSPNISLERFLEIIDLIIDKIDSTAEYRGWILHTDYHNRCGNCRAVLSDNEKYCTMCGTRRGEGSFNPYNNVTNALYGSPAIMKWKCSECNNVWVDWSFDRKRYCKECGHIGKYLKCDDPGGIKEWLEMTKEEAQVRMKRLLEEE